MNYSTRIEEEECFSNISGDEYDREETGVYLQEVPHTSSSLDCSSVGSIPWAEDAIKLNKLEWEKIENMLCGLEKLDTDEELRKEILDWQKKFPELLKRRPNNRDWDGLGFISDEETSNKNFEIRDNFVKCQEYKINKYSNNDSSDQSFTPLTREFTEEENTISELFDDFTLTSVRCKLNRRETMKNSLPKISSNSGHSALYSIKTPTPISPVRKLVPNSRVRMPPILNILESTRKFRGLAKNKHASFVQLTEVPQAKSAVIRQGEKAERNVNPKLHRSAWHIPLVQNRFFNNCNSIVLPAIPPRNQMHQNSIQHQPSHLTNAVIAKERLTSQFSNNTNLRRNFNSRHHCAFTAARATSSQTNSSSSGRSISAVTAVTVAPYSKLIHNATHLPFSTYAYKPFK